MGRIYGETDKETENVNSEVKADSIKTSKKPKKSLSKRSAVILSLVLGAAIGAGSCVGYSVYATGNVLGIAAENQKSGAEYIATLKAHGVAITQDSVQYSSSQNIKNVKLDISNSAIDETALTYDNIDTLVKQGKLKKVEAAGISDSSDAATYELVSSANVLDVVVSGKAVTGIGYQSMQTDDSTALNTIRICGVTVTDSLDKVLDTLGTPSYATVCDTHTGDANTNVTLTYTAGSDVLSLVFSNDSSDMKLINITYTSAGDVTATSQTAPASSSSSSQTVSGNSATEESSIVSNAANTASTNTVAISSSDMSSVSTSAATSNTAE